MILVLNVNDISKCENSLTELKTLHKTKNIIVYYHVVLTL